VDHDNKKILDEVVAQFRASFHERSFSERHKELGKMVKCQVCRTRHRASRVCEQRFAGVRVGVDPGDLRQTEPVNPKPRLGIGSRNRVNPHFSKRRLLLVQRVQEFIANMPGSENFATEVRDLMQSSLKKSWRQSRRAYQKVQKRSRAINRSL
jgi:hypothetical protein